MPSTSRDLKAIRALKERLERELIALSKEMIAMSETEELKNENSIKLLALQQERMAEDIKSINAALNKVADALQDLAVLEQKHQQVMDTAKRAHDRIDVIDKIYGEIRRDYERESRAFQKEIVDRLQSIEIYHAKTQWIERAAVAVLMGIIGLWIKSGV